MCVFLNHKTRSNQHLKHCSARYLDFGGVKYGGQKNIVDTKVTGI